MVKKTTAKAAAKAPAKKVKVEEEVPQLTTNWMLVFVGVMVFIGLLGVRITDKYGSGGTVTQTTIDTSSTESLNATPSFESFETKPSSTETFSDGLQPTINIVQ